MIPSFFGANTKKEFDSKDTKAEVEGGAALPPPSRAEVEGGAALPPSSRAEAEGGAALPPSSRAEAEGAKLRKAVSAKLRACTLLSFVLFLLFLWLSRDFGQVSERSRGSFSTKFACTTCSARTEGL